MPPRKKARKRAAPVPAPPAPAEEAAPAVLTPVAEKIGEPRGNLAARARAFGKRTGRTGTG